MRMSFSFENERDHIRLPSGPQKLQGTMFTPSEHNPCGTSPHFDNERITELICRYQALGDPEALAGLIALSQERVRTLIRFNGSNRYLPEDELLSNVNWKLIRAISRFNQERGTPFSFISTIAMNEIRSAVTNARRRSSRFVALDETVSARLITNGESESRTIVDDLENRLKSSFKTTLSDDRERDVQKWLVTSFCADGFESRRHECADAAMAVFSIGHERARELHDLSLLETRRILHPDLPPRPPIAPGRLVGTRAQWMLRYAHLLNADEFTRFFTLSRDLSPFIVVLIAPESRSRRLDRNPPIDRRNLMWIISGHPAATPLFNPLPASG
jgi:DNA-directed RNA polymerase specialized sigma24 family protein